MEFNALVYTVGFPVHTFANRGLGNLGPIEIRYPVYVAGRYEDNKLPEMLVTLGIFLIKKLKFAEPTNTSLYLKVVANVIYIVRVSNFLYCMITHK